MFSHDVRCQADLHGVSGVGHRSVQGPAGTHARPPGDSWGLAGSAVIRHTLRAAADCGQNSTGGGFISLEQHNASGCRTGVPKAGGDMVAYQLDAPPTDWGLQTVYAPYLCHRRTSVWRDRIAYSQCPIGNGEPEQRVVSL